MKEKGGKEEEKKGKERVGWKKKKVRRGRKKEIEGGMNGKGRRKQESQVDIF